MPKQVFSAKVGITAVKVLSANPDRISYTLQHRGTADVASGGTDNVTTDQGEILSPGQLVSDPDDKEDVYLISGTANQDIRVTELTKAKETP